MNMPANTTASPLPLIAALCSALLCACAAEAPPVDRVQGNLVDKAIFEGEWWYSSTAVDVDYDAAQIFSSANAWAPFEGSMSTDYGIDFNRSGPYVIGSPTYSFPIARIRWVIDEDYLFAFRSFELVQGGNDDARDPEYRGQPLAVFAIDDHVDVRKGYSETTGEETNVTEENTQDRRWFERKFMRVDWSQNLITEFAANDAQANELFQSFNRESTPFFVQEGGGDYPESYRPQFVRLQDEADDAYRFAGEWPEDERDKVHYMSFVTKETWSPAGGCLQWGGTCAAAAVTMRNAFLRVPPGHEYAVATMSNTEFDRFGIFRSHQPTYARGGRDRDTEHEFCSEDAHCGEGGACDLARNVCTGGLTTDRGETDFLSFYMSRQNLFSNSLTSRECVADWECDGRHVGCDDIDDGDDRDACERDLTAMQGSTCDPAARRCTVPLRDRDVRKIEYKLSAHFPPYLVREAFAAMAEWNEALMRARRATQGRLPLDQIACDDDEEEELEDADQRKGDGICTFDLGDATVQCQDENPGIYCFCGSPEEQRGFCKRAYQAFESPDAARERGVPNPYDCYVEGPSDVEHPQDFADYTPRDAYAYRFVGDECMLTLVPNGCDVAADAPCEELGDLRHQFVTHVQHGAVPFGGVAQPLSDPTTGELVVSNASIAAVSIENVGTTASQLFPVLRGETPEDSFFAGENLRGYYARLDQVEHPVSIAPSGTDGYSVGDESRPPTSHADLFAGLDARMQALTPKMQKLYGQEGRAAVLDDRLQQLRGSALASRIDSAIRADVSGDPNESSTSSAGTGKPTSLVDNSPLDEVLRERQRREIMAARNMDDFDARLYNSQYWQYWADAFDGYPLAEASLRMQQVHARSVISHEIGHALGLRHNFAGSLDRDNYHDAYYELARDLPLPAYLQYDDAENGGDGDGDVTGEEAQRWADDLRRVRQERLARGAGNIMTSSVMDYDGDFSGYAGMGRYDAAAVMFSYFDAVEAYDATDPAVFPGTLSDEAEASLSLQGLQHADSYRRELWTYYRGGETCRAQGDCPHRAGSETVVFQPITQRCVSNPRVPNATGDCADGGCICSNFYDDFGDYLAGRAYRPTTIAPEYAPVDYLYCHDNRVNDLSWCTRFDAGESFQEVIDHYRLSWAQRYPQVYFRNYRREGPTRGFSQDSVVDAVKIYQHLFFRFNYEGVDFRNGIGALSYADQLFASADVLNWLGEIIASPDVGAYSFDADANTYRQISTDPEAEGADLSLAPGQGFYLWSAYQEGHQGFFRLERAGTFLDKLLAIEALARRDWGLSYTVDERYFINFYDLFDREVIDLFGGLILRDPAAYAPRAGVDASGEPIVRYLNLYRSGDRGNNASTYTEPAIDGTDSEVLRDAAAIQALSTFPIFYDTSFEQRLLVFKNGSGEGYEIPATRADGTATCAYGDDDCDVPDYIVYDSDRLHTSYVAVVIQPNLQSGIDEQQLGYQLLLKLTQNQERIRELVAQDELTQAESAELLQRRLDLERDEGFIDYLIELGRAFGISTYLF